MGPSASVREFFLGSAVFKWGFACADCHKQLQISQDFRVYTHIVYDMEVKIGAAEVEKLADRVEERVSRKYEIRFRQLEAKICQLEQKLSPIKPRQKDETIGRQKKKKARERERDPCKRP